MLTKPAPYRTDEHRFLRAIRPNIQPWIADGIGSQFAHGATVEDVYRQLTAAAAQIDRVRNHFAADPSALREVIRTAARDLARA